MDQIKPHLLRLDGKPMSFIEKVNFVLLNSKPLTLDEIAKEMETDINKVSDCLKGAENSFFKSKKRKSSVSGKLMKTYTTQLGLMLQKWEMKDGAKEGAYIKKVHENLKLTGSSKNGIR